MESNDQKSLANLMDMQALRVYALLAVVIYLLSIIYCISTDHVFEAGLIGVVLLGLGSLVAWIYKN